MSEIEFKQNVRGQLGFVPLDTTAEYDHAILTDRYWVVHPEFGLAWHRRNAKARYWTPQCNRNEAITTSLRDKLYPGLEVRFVPGAAVSQWDEDYGHQPITITTPYEFVIEGPVRPALIGDNSPYKEGT